MRLTSTRFPPSPNSTNRTPTLNASLSSGGPGARHPRHTSCTESFARGSARPHSQPAPTNVSAASACVEGHQSDNQHSQNQQHHSDLPVIFHGRRVSRDGSLRKETTPRTGQGIAQLPALLHMARQPAPMRQTRQRTKRNKTGPPEKKRNETRGAERFDALHWTDTQREIRALPSRAPPARRPLPPRANLPRAPARSPRTSPARPPASTRDARANPRRARARRFTLTARRRERRAR